MRVFSQIILFLLLVTLLGLVVSKYVHLEPSGNENASEHYKDYVGEFTALIEKEISRNSAASKPVVKISDIVENKNELSIAYNLSFDEKFADGESTNRNTRAWALLKRDSPAMQWKLYKLRDAHQTVRFNKGSVVGS
jgi:hypothetical protein